MTQTLVRCPIFLLLLLSVGVQAQRVDSLWRVWHDRLAPDTVRLQALHDLCWDLYLFNKPDSGLIYARQMEALARSGDYPLFVGKAINAQGTAYYNLGNYVGANERFQEAMHIFEMEGSLLSMADALNNLGNIHQEQGNYGAAMAYFTRSMHVYEKSDDQQKLAGSLNNIGNVYQEQGDFFKAKTHYRRSLEIAEKMRDTVGMAYALGNLAVVSHAQANFGEAVYYLNRSIGLWRVVNDQFELARALSNLGTVYQDWGDYAAALENSIQALALQEAIEDRQGMCNSLCNIGLYHLSQNKLDNARAYGLQAMRLARETGSVLSIKQAASLLYEVHKRKGEYAQALHLFELMVSMGDSVRNENNVKEVTRLALQYDFEKQLLADSLIHAEALLLGDWKLQRQRNFTLLSIAGLLLVALLLFLVYRGLKHQRHTNRLLAEEKQKSDALLLNILPAEVAEELKLHGGTRARLYDSVTVLFTDFAGFKQVAEEMSPVALVAELDKCFKAFDAIVDRYGLEKIKTIGDAYLAVSGLPEPTAAHARQAALAALAMRDFMVAHQQQGGLFRVRIGLHSGPVVAGVVGKKKFQYDIWGDTVNTAARMEEGGQPGRVNVSETTMKSLLNDASFQFDRRGKISAKNKGEIDMYFLESNPAHHG